MIPAHIDAVAILADMRAMGWIDSKVEIAIGVSAGYFAQVKAGHIKEPSYAKAARLYNLWEAERTLYLQHLAEQPGAEDVDFENGPAI